MLVAVVGTNAERGPQHFHVGLSGVNYKGCQLVGCHFDKSFAVNQFHLSDVRLEFFGINQCTSGLERYLRAVGEYDELVGSLRFGHNGLHVLAVHFVQHLIGHEAAQKQHYERSCNAHGVAAKHKACLRAPSSLGLAVHLVPSGLGVELFQRQIPIDLVECFARGLHFWVVAIEVEAFRLVEWLAGQVFRNTIPVYIFHRNVFVLEFDNWERFLPDSFLKKSAKPIKSWR